MESGGRLFRYKRRMIVKTVSWYHDFHCIQGECPVTCCFGWGIPLDDEICETYHNMKGLKGFLIRSRIRGGKLKSFRLSLGKCPFQDRESLCGLQRKLGEEYMPRVCREYPRQCINLGGFAVRTLDAGCPEAARLLLTAEDPLGFTDSEEEIESRRYGNNEEPEFLASLEKLLPRLLSLLREDSGIRGLNHSFNSLLQYAEKAQEACIRGEKLPEASFCEEDRFPLFPFSIMLFNELYSTSLFEERLSILAPKLYRPLKRYYRVFDRLTEIQGQELLDSWVSCYFGEDPGRLRKYSMIAGYFLQLDFYDIYEDYSFFTHIIQAVLHANMILMLDLTVYNAEGELPLRRQCELLAAYTRRAHHNDEVAKELFRRIMDRYG